MTTDTKAVERWNSWGGETDIQESDTGQFVLFTDYERVVGELKEERRRWFLRAGEYLKRAQSAECALAAARAQVEGLKKDAERYRWLREQKRPEHLASERYIAVAVHDWTANLNPRRVGVNTWGNATVSDEVLDRIVDAAMEKGNV